WDRPNAFGLVQFVPPHARDFLPALGSQQEQAIERAPGHLLGCAPECLQLRIVEFALSLLGWTGRHKTERWGKLDILLELAPSEEWTQQDKQFAGPSRFFGFDQSAELPACNASDLGILA